MIEYKHDGRIFYSASEPAPDAMFAWSWGRGSLEYPKPLKRTRFWVDQWHQWPVVLFNRLRYFRIWRVVRMFHEP